MTEIWWVSESGSSRTMYSRSFVGAAPRGLLASALGFARRPACLSASPPRRTGGDQPGQLEDVPRLRERLAHGPVMGEARITCGRAASMITEPATVTMRCPARTVAYTANR